MSPVRQTHTADSSEQTPRASQAPSNNTLQPAADNALRPARSPPASVHSSFNEGSDMDQVEETVAPVTLSEAPAGPEKEKRRLFRWSHRKEDKEAKEAAKEAAATGQQQQQSGLPPPLASPRRMPAVIGSNSGAEISATSIGSLSGGNKARKSLTNEQSDVSDQQQHQQQRGSGDSGRGGELAAAGAPSKEKNERGPIGWIKNKMREAKSDKEKRNKSPPPPSQASASAERTSKDSPQQQQSVATGALTAANIALKPGWVVPGTAGPGTATTMAEKPKSLEIPRGEAAKSTGPLSS